MSIGKQGTSYVQNDIPWQKITYENTDSGFMAALPGTVQVGTVNGEVFGFSRHQDVVYEIHTHMSQRYAPPSTEKAFLQELEKAFSKQATIAMTRPTQKRVKYSAELHFLTESKVIQLYCSSNCLYWAIVEGKDLSLAPLFFESIQVTK